MKLALVWDGDTGDGKRAFVVAEQNDGWQDLRIEVDTDDCDSDFAKAAMQEVIDRVNAHRASLDHSVNASEVDELKRRLKAVIDESDIQSSQLACAAVVIREARALGEIILKNEQLTEAEFGIMNVVAHVQLYDEMFPPVGENVSLDDVLPDPEATPG